MQSAGNSPGKRGRLAGAVRQPAMSRAARLPASLEQGVDGQNICFQLFTKRWMCRETLFEAWKGGISLWPDSNASKGNWIFVAYFENNVEKCFTVSFLRAYNSLTTAPCTEKLACLSESL